MAGAVHLEQECVCVSTGVCSIPVDSIDIIDVSATSTAHNRTSLITLWKGRKRTLGKLMRTKGNMISPCIGNLL